MVSCVEKDGSERTKHISANDGDASAPGNGVAHFGTNWDARMVVDREPPGWVYI